jgi:cobalt-zinc-cadmium efflux system protein
MPPPPGTHTHSHGPGHRHGPADHAPHADHAERAPPSGGARALVVALVLTAGFGIVEAVAGWLSGSLALISDAGHMATDAAAFLVALIAHGIARRPPSQRASYGYARAEVLAAFINALAMLALIVWISVEAVQRLLAPVPIAGPVVMAVAAAGLAVNILVAWMLSRSSGGLNVRGALLHVLGDILGSVAALVAGAVVRFTGWTPIDPILALFVALLILRSTWVLLQRSTGVLMEGVPAHLSYDAIGRALAALPGVCGIHDLHVWTMSADRVALSAHVTLADGETWLQTLASAQRMLARDFGIDHVTLQPAWPAQPAQPAHRRVIPVAPAAADRRRPG